MSKTRRIIRLIDDLVDKGLTVLFLIVFFIGLYSIIDTYYVFNAAAEVAVPYYKPTKGNVTDILKELSEDCVAWISIDDTKLDFPVMQGEDNNKYLNRNPYGEYSLAGSIYLDSRNSGDFSDDYSLLYGHHMSNGYMFGCIDDFSDEEFFNEHRDGELLVSDEIYYRVKTFAFIETDAKETLVFDPTESDVNELLKFIKDNAQIYVTPDNKHIVGLSTCKSPLTTTRYVLFVTIQEEQE